MADDWFSMAADVERTCYDHVSRYTTSAFMRLKLGDALARRNVAPHIFETSADAHQFVVK
jgi:propionate CoA-transferase